MSSTDNKNEIPLFTAGDGKRRRRRHGTRQPVQTAGRSGRPARAVLLADTYVSFGDFPQAEYWAQKAADKGDGDALALLAQLKIRNPQQADYRQAKALAENRCRPAVGREK